MLTNDQAPTAFAASQREDADAPGCEGLPGTHVVRNLLEAYRHIDALDEMVFGSGVYSKLSKLLGSGICEARSEVAMLLYTAHGWVTPPVHVHTELAKLLPEWRRAAGLDQPQEPKPDGRWMRAWLLAHAELERMREDENPLRTYADGSSTWTIPSSTRDALLALLEYG